MITNIVGKKINLGYPMTLIHCIDMTGTEMLWWSCEEQMQDWW
jgi:hypothetical protein